MKTNYIKLLSLIAGLVVAGNIFAGCSNYNTKFTCPCTIKGTLQFYAPAYCDSLGNMKARFQIPAERRTICNVPKDWDDTSAQCFQG